MQLLDEHTLFVYTDGSCFHAPRRGGIGIVFVRLDDAGGEQVTDMPQLGFRGATNNQMELTACIEALRALTGKRPLIDPVGYDKVVIFTDSMYVVNNFNSAKFEWPRSGWMTRDGAPVLNAQLWKDLIKQAKKLDELRTRVVIEYIKGHGTSPLNKRADKLAKRSAQSPGPRHISQPRLRRKLSPKSVEVGSVPMEGQELRIRIISDESLPVQRLLKYRYEVVSEDSPFFQNVDFVYSSREISLSRGHTYDVRFNEDTKNPRIAELLGEVVATRE